MKNMVVLCAFVIVAMTSLLSFSHAMPQNCGSIENQLRELRREFALREQRIKKLRESRNDAQRRQAELQPAIKGWSEMVDVLKAEQEGYSDLLSSEFTTDNKLVERVNNKLQAENNAVDEIRGSLHELRGRINNVQAGLTRESLQELNSKLTHAEIRLKTQHVRQVIYQRILIQVAATGRAGLERESKVVSQLLGRQLEGDLQRLRQELTDSELTESSLRNEIITAEQFHENQRGQINSLQNQLENCRPPPPEVRVISIQINPPIISAGQSADIVVTINKPAPASGISVSLDSDNSGSWQVFKVRPTHIGIPAGSTQAKARAVTDRVTNEIVRVTFRAHTGNHQGPTATLEIR